MDKSLRKIISGVGLLGFFVNIVIIAFLINSEATAPFLIDNSPFLVILFVGWFSTKLALKQPQFSQKPVTFIEMAKIGAFSGLVAVTPFLLIGCGYLISAFRPSRDSLEVSLTIFIFLSSGIGVLLSAIGGGIGMLGANKQLDALDNQSAKIKGKL